MTALDRFITKLIEQKLTRYMDPAIAENSYAYRKGKGIQEAVMAAKTYIEAGNRFLVAIDIRDFFDSIPLEEMMKQLEEVIQDRRVCSLIRKYLYCNVDSDGQIIEKKQGLVQGNSISPVLSNWYLRALDTYLESKEYNWLRYADNIYLYAESREKAIHIYNEVCKYIREHYSLKVNEKKSGVFDAYTKRILGYEFVKKSKKVEVRKYCYKREATYRNWRDCVVEKVNHEYHIITDGIINKKDYALLFENEDEKHHIPVEVVDQINFYNDITIGSGVFKTLNEKNIKATFFDKYGNLVGCYLPEKRKGDTRILLKQCEMYSGKERLNVAKQMQIASIHNMRANIRYYNKKKNLEDCLVQLSGMIKEVNEGKTINSLMLTEARARQVYYEAFNTILNNDDFLFTVRSKRPPKDEINAMISFGNTLLYNQFLQYIWKTPLDPRIGMVHATNRRSHSLNLDFADIFKPIIVDRVIFTLINCHQIKVKEHFQQTEDGGVYLSKIGKHLFIEEFNRKLSTGVVIKGESITYKRLMQREVQSYLKLLTTGEKYKPYRYY